MQNELAPPRRFTGMRRKVSLFFVSAILGMGGLILLVSYKQGAFVRHTPIYFYTADAFGISKGMAVKLFGIPVGGVKEMDISDRGVMVELSIVSDYTSRIPKDSVARMVREGYIGAANIQIVPGADSSRGDTVQGGEVIQFIPAKGVAELMDELKTQLNPVLNEARRIVADMKRPDSDFHKSVNALETTLWELPATTHAAHQALQSADRALATLGRQAEATLGSAARLGAQAELELPKLTGRLATTLDTLNETSAQFRDALRRNSDALHDTLSQAPAIMREGGDLVRDGQEIIGAARNVWPFRDLIDAPVMRTLPVDSFETSRQARAPSSAPVQR